jgi:hypothetical protein
MKKSVFMNSLKYPGLMCVLLCLGALQSAPASQHQQVLPGNAIVHAEIRSLLEVVAQAENFLKSGIPDELAPPDVRDLMNQDHPLLTVLGMKMMGKPLEPEFFSRSLGIDSDAPVTATLYPGDPRKFFIVSMGLTSAENFLGAVTSPEGPVKAVSISIGGLDLVKIPLEIRGADALYGLVRGNRVYVSGESSLLLLLDDTEGYERLNEDPHMSDVLQRTDEMDLFLTIHPDLIKPLYKQVGFFKFLPVSLLSLKKQEFLAKIPEDEKEMIDMQIRMQMPVDGLDELLDYGECAVTAIYHTVFDSLLSKASSFEGLTFGIRAKAEVPGLFFMVHGSDKARGAVPGAIPMEELRSALERFPGDIPHWSAVGQKPAAVPSQWMTRTLDKMHDLMAAKELDTAWLEKLRKVHVESQLVQPLESGAGWTLNAAAQVGSMPKPEAFDSMDLYFAALMEQQFNPTWRTVTVVPGKGPDFLEAFLEQKKQALQSIDEDVLSLLPPNQRHRWIDQLYRHDSADLDNGVTILTWENVWRTRSGLFGFNEHELVNRKRYAARKVGNHLVFHKSSDDGEWLQQFDWQSNHKPGRSRSMLVGMVPDGSYSISFLKLSGILPAAIHGLAGLEDLAHRDIHQYLEKVKTLSQDTRVDDRAALIKEMMAVSMPVTLAKVSVHSETGEFYGMIPGDIAFPRPRIMPILEELIADYEKDVRNVGGLLTYARHDGGTREYGIMHHTGALTSFIRKTGNSFARLYLKDSEGIQKLMGRAMSPLDMRPHEVKSEEVLIRNPRWAFVDQIQSRPGTQLQTYEAPEMEAMPQNPIPPRSEELPDHSIDLTFHYNAALNDEFHKGGMPDNTLATFPAGKFVVEEIEFDARGLVHLNGLQLQNTSVIQYPEVINDIDVWCEAEKLHFLHGTGWPAAEGQPVCFITVNYEDGSEERIPVRYGIETLDWWTAPDSIIPPNSIVAWEGENKASAGSEMSLRLYMTSWENPHPEMLIISISLESAMTDSSPFFLAVTAE